MSQDHDLDQRLRFLKVDEHGRAALRSLKPFLDEELPGALDACYDQLRSSPATRSHFRDSGLVDQALGAQRTHWKRLANGDYGEGYCASIGAVGQLHAKAGLEPSWHIDGCALVAEQLVRAMVRRTWPKAGLLRDKKTPTADQVADGLAALVKAMMLDMDFVVQTYLDIDAEARAQSEQALIEQQRAVADTISLGLEKLAEGDLEFRLTDPLPEPFEPLRADFNGAVDEIRQTVLDIGRDTRAIRAGAGELASNADDLARRTEQQAASLEQTAAALDEITVAVRQTADGADHARGTVAKAKADAERGGAVVRQAVTAMNKIESSSRQVSQIVGVIDEIAFQTNLLALNAAVEAARVGDAGRGFAVVAQEVRALAQRSAAAAKEIKGLISASSDQIGSGVKLVGETGESLERIVTQVADINGVVAEIAASAKAQASGLQEVNSAVNQMDQAVQQNAAMIQQSTSASHALALEAEDLAKLLRRFHIARREPVRAAPQERLPPPGRLAIEAKTSAFVQRYAAPQLTASGGGAAPIVGRPVNDWDES
jgi:methyl-accepting chemotaxis protein